TFMIARPRSRHGSTPSTRTRPALGRSNPTPALISVDLPAPFGPTSAVMLPRGTATSTSLSAHRRRRPYRLPTPRASNPSAVPSAIPSPSGGPSHDPRSNSREEGGGCPEAGTGFPGKRRKNPLLVSGPVTNQRRDRLAIAIA